MKKKILSLLLAVLMITGCFATFTAPASAKGNFYYEGETFTYSFKGNYSTVPSSGNVCNIGVSAPYFCGSAAIVDIAQNGKYISVTMLAIEYGGVVLTRDAYNESSGQWEPDSEKLSICPVLTVGEERTLRINESILSSACAENTVKDIVTGNESVAKVTGAANADVDSVDVTVVGVKSGTVSLNCQRARKDYKGDYYWDDSLFFYMKVVLPTADLTADSGSIGLDQNYNVDVTQNYVDTTRVKLEWELDEINASYTSTKTWNAIDLKWEEVKSEAEAPSATATFKLTNYSSTKICGSAAFATVDDEKIAATFSSAVFENNGLAVDTMVNADHTIDDNKKDTAPSNTITATLTFHADAFKELAATEEKEQYGTYTITISEAPETKTVMLCMISSQPGFSYFTFEDLELTGSVWSEAAGTVVSYNDGAAGELTIGQDKSVMALYNGSYRAAWLYKADNATEDNMLLATDSISDNQILYVKLVLQ